MNCVTRIGKSHPDRVRVPQEVSIPKVLIEKHSTFLCHVVVCALHVHYVVVLVRPQQNTSYMNAS